MKTKQTTKKPPARSRTAKGRSLKRVVMPETMWAIHGRYGFYTGTALRRKDMISRHVAGRAREWEYCKRAGDRAVKVRISLA